MTILEKQIATLVELYATSYALVSIGHQFINDGKQYEGRLMVTRGMDGVEDCFFDCYENHIRTQLVRELAYKHHGDCFGVTSEIKPKSTPINANQLSEDIANATGGQL